MTFYPLVQGLTRGDILAHAARFREENWDVGERPTMGDIAAVLGRWRERRWARFVVHMARIGVLAL